MKTTIEKSQELYQFMSQKGYPEYFTNLIIKNLNTEYAVQRMLSYLSDHTLRSEEDIVNEMFCIFADEAANKQQDPMGEENTTLNYYLFSKRSENDWEDHLHIHTTGVDISSSDQNNFPYEPTPYAVLEKLADSEYINAQNVLLDYGCGKGRVPLYLSSQTGCKAIGIDYNHSIIQVAQKNLKESVCKNNVSFEQSSAENYIVPIEVDRCYFFNPFSEIIFEQALQQILNSCQKKPRELFLFLYYPSEEYLHNNLLQTHFILKDEISSNSLSNGLEERVKICIFQFQKNN